MDVDVRAAAVETVLRILNGKDDGGLYCEPPREAHHLTPQFVRGALVVARRVHAAALDTSWREGVVSESMVELISALLCVLAGFDGSSGSGWWRLRDDEQPEGAWWVYEPGGGRRERG